MRRHCVMLVDKPLQIEAINVYDEEKNHRYRLYRCWDKWKDKAAVIMFNPARLKPTAFRIGQTLSSITRYLEEENIGSIDVVNLYPFVAEKKKLLLRLNRKFDETNFKYVVEAVSSSKRVVLFWGKDTIVSKNPRFIELLLNNNEKLYCFKVTKNNQPDYIYGISKNSLKKCFINENGEVTVN
jgi:hypothetical protein